MKVTVGTFNLNNLFSRWNFTGAIKAIQDGDQANVTVRYTFEDPDTFNVRTFKGRLVKAKDPVDTQRIADRIITNDVDVLAVQEVENVGILREFNRDYLSGPQASHPGLLRTPRRRDPLSRGGRVRVGHGQAASSNNPHDPTIGGAGRRM